jgi:hypothetical protein
LYHHHRVGRLAVSGRSSGRSSERSPAGDVERALRGSFAGATGRRGQKCHGLDDGSPLGRLDVQKRAKRGYAVQEQRRDQLGANRHADDR